MTVRSTTVACLLAALMLATIMAAAENYYVDALQGDNRNDGTSPATAWKTLGRLRRQRFAVGDEIRLKRGSIWHEQLVLSTASGLRLGAYGSGPAPVVDGEGVPLPRDTALLTLADVAEVSIEDVDIRNSSGAGILLSNSTSFALSGALVHDNSADGIRVWNSSNILISGNKVFRNNSRAVGHYSGITVDGAGGRWSDITLSSNDVYDNVGGPRWENCADGIYLGHTGARAPAFHGLRVIENAVYRNGDPVQNQIGRGISGYFSGDAAISRNDIHDNASAGVYLSGPELQLTFTDNKFRNNHLRAFGWIADGFVSASNNLIISSDPSLTGTGIEYGGKGRFEVVGNVFWLHPDGRYGAFIAVHANATLPRASHNTYWNAATGPGSRAFLIGDYRQPSNYISFTQWQSETGDWSSSETKPNLSAQSLR